MKNKVFFTIGMISLTIFIVIASYLWFIYFDNKEKEMLSKDKELEFIRGVELINSGSIEYINAKIGDSDEVIPKYYFRIKNNMDKDYQYEVYLDDKEDSNDASSFNRDELVYELKLDNKVIKSGLVSTLHNNLLDSNTIHGGKINDYSLRIWLNEDITNYANKHFNYVVNLKEKE